MSRFVRDSISGLATRYVYEHSLETNEIDFFNFVQQFMIRSALR
jgi:hypothetical protein